MSQARKRTYLKPSQIAVLEETFVSNALPEYHTRCNLAKELDISERTIQIWFQNRRAQFRKDRTIQPTVRRGWIKPSSAKVPFQSTPCTIFPSLVSKPVINLVPYGREVAAVLPVTGLSIGKWSRFANRTHPNDLICFGDQDQFYWQVKEDSNQFRIQIQYYQIQRIVLAQHYLTIEFSGTPLFSMRQAENNWIACADFTEHQQATFHQTHCLQGHPPALKSIINHLSFLFTQITHPLSPYHLATSPLESFLY